MGIAVRRWNDSIEATVCLGNGFRLVKEYDAGSGSDEEIRDRFDREFRDEYPQIVRLMGLMQRSDDDRIRERRLAFLNAKRRAIPLTDEEVVELRNLDGWYADDHLRWLNHHKDFTFEV